MLLMIYFRYGVFSFILIFIVERLGGILQATLTLNGLIGGVMLGLFCLGILFKRANRKVNNKIGFKPILEFYNLKTNFFVF